MHTDSNFVLKRALHFGTLTIKRFNSGAKLFKAIIFNAAL